ncbi:MAG: DUF2845 domain-containing protein [Proteobacteria bacterium]|jgi:hypothetical protein|nr:DUF2845 domain-containing protein [Pseudomonadota bacterium]
MKTIPIVLAVLCFAELIAAGASAQTLSCDDGVVEMSDSKYLVESKCGEPTFTDATRVTRVSERGDEVLQEFVEVEDWLYDFGPNRLVVVLTFEKDRLIGMRSFGYGRDSGGSPAFDKVVAIGEPTVRVLFLFGPPSYKEERIDTSVVSREHGGAFPKQVSVETWTYNLGPNRFMRIYHFVNGRLTAIERGPRGF